jgi:hypothetical protein
MTKSHLLAGALLAATLALGGCVVRGSGGLYVRPAAVVVVEAEPPPPRVEYYAPRPGFIWITGRWVHHGGRWDWRAGHWERERVGYVYAPGRWERRGRGHVWVEGRWNRGGGRGHQHIRVDNDRNKNNGGVKVRDHRR